MYYTAVGRRDQLRCVHNVCGLPPLAVVKYYIIVLIVVTIPGRCWTQNTFYSNILRQHGALPRRVFCDTRNGVMTIYVYKEKKYDAHDYIITTTTDTTKTKAYAQKVRLFSSEWALI